VVSAEQLARQHIFADFEIRGDFQKDSAERSNFQRTMRGNRDLVFCASKWLPDCLISS